MPGYHGMSFDNDFVASGSVLLPDPPDVQRGGEMPPETLERRLNALKFRDTNDRKVGRQMVREMTRVRSQQDSIQSTDQTVGGPLDVSEDSFRPFAGPPVRDEDEWSERGSEESLNSEDSDDNGRSWCFCCVASLPDRRHRVDDVIPNRKAVKTDESVNLLDDAEIEMNEAGDDDNTPQT